MCEWKLSDDQSAWELTDGTRVVATLRWSGNSIGGIYVDGDGKPIHKKFEEARRILEQRYAARGAQ